MCCWLNPRWILESNYRLLAECTAWDRPSEQAPIQRPHGLLICLFLGPIWHCTHPSCSCSSPPTDLPQSTGSISGIQSRSAFMSCWTVRPTRLGFSLGMREGHTPHTHTPTKTSLHHTLTVMSENLPSQLLKSSVSFKTSHDPIHPYTSSYNRSNH